MAAKLARFRSYVESTAKSRAVKAIAEESNGEIEINRGRSIARIVAEGMQPPLAYIPCEPSSSERETLGISEDERLPETAPDEFIGLSLEEYRDAQLLRFFPAREKFWIERLRNGGGSSTLFICGANHVSTFACRLIEAGIPCKVVSFDWWASDDRDNGPLPLDERPI
ncbi:MAG TPA: hypothetical protein VMH32_13120 [Burkholderiales bacterium]|nr:hypothetical protein [Burkholderiales bacterium]